MTVVCSRSQYKVLREDKEEFVCVDTPGLDDELAMMNTSTQSLRIEDHGVYQCCCTRFKLREHTFSTSLQK